MAQGSLQTATSWERVSPVTGRRFFLLFLFLLGDLVFYPYVANDQGARYYLFRVLTISVTALSVYAVSFRRGLIFVAVLLAFPAMLSHTVLFRSHVNSFAILNVFGSFAFDVFVIVVMFRRVYAREKPSAETIYGALCVYLMVGFTFARLYALISALRPHAFYLDPATNSRSVPVGFDFIFFSFGTMTSLGVNGTVAVLPVVRSFSVMESILGVLYLAVMISRLMSAYQSNFPEPNSQGQNSPGLDEF
jgi:Ca2+/Na+ antiporter